MANEGNEPFVFLTRYQDKSRALTTVFEILGSVLAMSYAILIAANIGAEQLSFTLLLLSSALFTAWAIIDKRWTFLLLQVFYAVSAIVGLLRWG